LVRILRGNLLGLLVVFVMKRPLREQSRDGRTHFDTHKA